MQDSFNYFLGQLVELFNFFLFAHVIHPDEKGNEADDDEQLVKPGTHPVHDLKNELEKICYKMPEWVHDFLFLVGQINIYPFCWSNLFVSILKGSLVLEREGIK